MIAVRWLPDDAAGARRSFEEAQLDVGILARMATVIAGAVIAGFSLGTALAVSYDVSAGVIGSMTGLGLGVGLVLTAFVGRKR